ncbi:hypothetical protein L0D12_16820, partial [Salmonella enterica subsp. enterica]|nr:hypothetical protein [Salmonella enterica subsp. enterica]
MNKTKDIAASPLCFVSPYPQLAKAAEALVAQLDYAVTIHQTTLNRILDELPLLESRGHQVLMNPLMILVKIIKLRWIHILSYDQMVSRKINNQTTRCANSIF